MFASAPCWMVPSISTGFGVPLFLDTKKWCKNFQDLPSHWLEKINSPAPLDRCYQTSGGLQPIPGRISRFRNKNPNLWKWEWMLPLNDPFRVHHHVRKSLDSKLDRSTTIPDRIPQSLTRKRQGRQASASRFALALPYQPIWTSNIGCLQFYLL